MLNSVQLSLFDDTNLSSSAYPLLSNIQSPKVELHVSDNVPLACDFRLVGERSLARGWKARAEDNIQAIELALKLAREGRKATRAEQEILINYTGFGASELANNLFPVGSDGFRKEWLQTGQKLKALISEEQHQALARSTQYAHYTPEVIIHGLWQKLLHMGFQGGRVLEPGCGSGLFIACMPERLALKTAFTAIEKDPITALIAKKLYPNSQVIENDFLKTTLKGSFDLAIGNPPFSDRKITYKGASLSLHEAFLAKSLDALKEGGIAAFVISRWFLDKQDYRARSLIATKAKLLGAIRLPYGSMREHAGTDVIVDVVLFQKTSETIKDEQDRPYWIETDDLEVEEGHFNLNRYFTINPNQVLGRHSIRSSPYGGHAYSCVRGSDDIPLSEAFLETLAGIEGDYQYPQKPQAAELQPYEAASYQGTVAEGALVREGSYLMEKGMLCQVVDGHAVQVKIRKKGEKEGLYQKQARMIKAYIPIRNAVRAILTAQMKDEPWGKYQASLHTSWKAFVQAFGAINKTRVTVKTDPITQKETEIRRHPNLAALRDDPDVWLVSAIEVYDELEDSAKPGAIFTERVISERAKPQICSVTDALAVVLEETGRVDIKRIMDYAACTKEEVIAGLKGLIFRDHTQIEQEGWVMADDYLSGSVRDKLKAVRSLALKDSRFAENVIALEKVQPEDLKPSEITARLGAPWLDTGYIEAFCEEVIGIKSTIQFSPYTHAWKVTGNAFKDQAEATVTWGTERRNAGLLLEHALNSTSPEVYDIVEEEGVQKKILNERETEAAKEKLDKIKNAFENWVWQDADRAEILCKTYNELYNNLVPRQFDGDHLRLPGASDVIKLRPFQKRVVWRIIASGLTYVAHTVGAGKTFSLCAAIMEQKRLGLVKKPVLVVPGHCLAQAAREFLMLYPMARILVADETNFEKSNRKRFLSRVATDHWDCIIITHDAFRFIPVPADFEKRIIRAEIEVVEQALKKADEDDFNRKEIEKRKEKLEGMLESKSNAIARDDLLHLGETGIDQIIVDEAHLFRKLSFETRQRKLRGIDPNGSQRAWDLYVKSRYIAGFNPDRYLIMASGSPITNTMGELFTIMRFMIPERLKERRLSSFDAWAGNFGETRTELELQPSGLYKPVTRFASFVNVADLMALYRSFADIVMREDLRSHVRLPNIMGQNRQIIVCPSSLAFKMFQSSLADRLEAIKNRGGKPKKGEDIILNVINDGRHGAIDLRLVDKAYGNEDASKLNVMIRQVFKIWQETALFVYSDPVTGEDYPLRGASQMIFSDLGTEASEARKGFSAYGWIRSELIRMGVPAQEIAFMQNYKKTSEKQKLFEDVNAGRKRILIGSTSTMGTGVNAQQRLIALHHLDVPWLVADIEQREGRILRQGNQNQEIQLFAYALSGSTDATSWQLLERKARFIALAMSGDRTIRKMEDVGETAGQFALAKALASGDQRLMEKAGLEEEIARLKRLKAAWKDNEIAVRARIRKAKGVIEAAQAWIPDLEADLLKRIKTNGEHFYMETAKGRISKRNDAGNYIMTLINRMREEERNQRLIIGKIGGFEIEVVSRWEGEQIDLSILTKGEKIQIDQLGSTELTLITKIENALMRLDRVLEEQKTKLATAIAQLAGYENQQNQPFLQAEELKEKEQKLAALESELKAASEENKAA